MSMTARQDKLWKAILAPLDELYNGDVAPGDVRIAVIAITSVIALIITKNSPGDRAAQLSLADTVDKMIRESITQADPDALPLH